MKFTKGAVSLAAAVLSLQIASSGALAAPEHVTKTTKAEDATAAPAAQAAPAKTEKTMEPVELTTAPDFTLKDTEGKSHTLSQYTKAGKVVVLEWFNPDCPFVKKHHV